MGLLCVSPVDSSGAAARRCGDNGAPRIQKVTKDVRTLRFVFMAHNDVVSVTIVTYNSGRFIKRFLESVLAQNDPLKEVVIVDNASTDGAVDLLEQFEDRCTVYYNDENIGFAAAQNQAIKLSSGEWVMTLNPDVLLLPNFIQSLVDAGQFDSKIGTVCGKLLTMTSHFEIPEKPVVDSTGIYFNPMLRHLDRGSQEVDN